MKRAVCRFAVAVAAAATTVSWANPKMPSPIKDAGDYGNGVGRVVTLAPSDYHAIKGLDRVQFEGFPLDAGLNVDLDLRALEVFAPDATLVVMTEQGEMPVPRPDVVIFGGTVEGDPDSKVMLSLSPYGLNGFIVAHDETWVLSSGPVGFGGPAVIYSLTNLPEGVINWAQWQCGTTDDHAAKDEVDRGGIMPESAGCRRVRMALDTDTSYLMGLFGGSQVAASAYAATIFAGATVIYSNDVNVEFIISFLRLWTTPSPYTSMTLNGRLDQFRNTWNASMTHIERDLAHLLCGDSIGGGIARFNSVCARSFGYAVSGELEGFFPFPLASQNVQNWDIIVVTHEIGHNMSARHTHELGIDGCGNGNCAGSVNGTIMSYCHLCPPNGIGNIQLRFHATNISQINTFLASLPCDLACPPPIVFNYPNGLPALAAPLGPTFINVQITGGGPQGVNPAFSRMTYAMGNGAKKTVNLQHLGGSDYRAVLPPGLCAERIEFYFSASSNGTDFTNDPPTGPTGAGYSVFTGDSATVILIDNAETNPGWVTSATATAGFWERGIPVNCNRGNPLSDFDGSGRCWLTENSQANACNSDVDNGAVYLRSPAFSSLNGSIGVQYALWYNNSIPPEPFEDVFVVEVAPSPNGPWTVVDIVGPTGLNVRGGWFVRSFRVSDGLASPSATTYFRFVASDYGLGSVVEAAVDDIRIISYDCPVICRADITGSSDPDDPGYGFRDGVVDQSDFFYFLDQFVAGNLDVADMTSTSDPDAPGYGIPDGVIDISDFFYYLDLFVQPCD
ncbi:MAG: hypothetical protein KF866_04970 [Phycisphaeraceae bacterium]|nr:hypothetical protein [Phycisphaeraceae bacterium]